MNLEAIQDKIKETSQAIADKTAELRKFCREQFPAMSDALFEKHPRLKSVAWAQYTPYFNDGDECVFRAHTSDCYINGTDGYGDERRGVAREGDDLYSMADKEIYDYTAEKYTGKKIPNPNYDPEAEKCVNDVHAFLKSFDKNILKSMFDEGLVVVTKEGVSVEDYEHE